MEFDLNEKQSQVRTGLREHFSTIEKESFMNDYYRDVFKEKPGAVLIDRNTDFVTKVTALIEVAKASPSLSLALLDTSVSVLAFEAYASALRNRSFAFTEETAGSDLSLIETTAKKTNEGWVLAGEKKHAFCTEFTEELIILAKLDESSFGIFNIPITDENVSLHKEEVMGLEGIHQTTITLSEVIASPSQMIIKTGTNLDDLNQVFNLSTLFMAAIAVGIAEKALSEALSYSRKRKQFGTIIGEYQAIQFKIAEAVVRINASKTLLYEAAQTLDCGEDAEAEISMSKVYASETAKIAVDHSLQIHGSAALVSGSPISKLYQFQRLTEIHGQTSELLRLKIADRLVKSYSDELVEIY